MNLIFFSDLLSDIDRILLQMGLNFLCLFLVSSIFDLVKTTFKESSIFVIFLLLYIIPVDFTAKLFPTYENLFPTYENFIFYCLLKSFDVIELTLDKMAIISLFFIIFATISYCFHWIQ